MASGPKIRSPIKVTGNSAVLANDMVPRSAWSVTVVVAVLGGFRLRTRTIQDRNRQLERLVQERTGALKHAAGDQALYQADERILRNVSLNPGLPNTGGCGRGYAAC